jgi:hypothetical protein
MKPPVQLHHGGGGQRRTRDGDPGDEAEQADTEVHERGPLRAADVGAHRGVRCGLDGKEGAAIRARRMGRRSTGLV